MSAPSGTGPLLDPTLRGALAPASCLYALCPFAPAWQREMREALGARYVREAAAASPVAAFDENAARLLAQLAPALASVADRLARGAAGTEEELDAYQRAAILALWLGYGPRLQGVIDANAVDAPYYDAFVEDYRRLLDHPGLTAPEPAHLFACLYQMRRAWYFAATMILGSSPSAAAARASLWRANLGSDPALYAASLYRSMDRFPVLITGETGTGKDCAARCIGWSRYVPFDAGTRRFARRYADDYHVKNLVEVPEELQESSLFGHKKGSFTGATSDATGFFALAGPHGTLFLDEVGELPLSLQAKLLRPLENREIVPVGETRPRPIYGRPVFATNRNLEEECNAGRFRADLYERMNGYRVHMPPLRRILTEIPDELGRYVRAFVAGMVDGRPADDWADRVTKSIRAAQPALTWPNNMRALKNYTERFVLTGGVGVELGGEEGGQGDEEARAGEEGEGEGVESVGGPPSKGEAFWTRARAGEVPLAEVMRAVVTQAHVSTGGNVAETAKKLDVDRRTVERWLDRARVGKGRKGPEEE